MLGLVTMSWPSLIVSFLSRIPIVDSSSCAPIVVPSFPACSLLIRCPCRHVVVLCGRHALFLHVVVAHNEQRRMMTNVVIRHLVPDLSELGWGEVGMGGAYHGVISSFCWRPGSWFPLVVLVVFVVVVAVSVCVAIRSCSFWGVRRCLGGRHRCLGGRTMTNDGFESIVRHLVATSLSATWHLGCVSVRQKEREDLLCMVTTLGVVTVRWRPNKVGCGGKVVVGRLKERRGNNANVFGQLSEHAGREGI